MFNLVPNWRQKVLINPLTAKMQETAAIGNRVIKERAHVVSGYMVSVSGVMFDQSKMRIIEYSDAPYSMVEEMRGKSHAFMAPAAQAMAGFWGGKWDIEIHFPNAALMGKGTTHADLAAREKRWRKQNLGFMARRKVTVHARRWHKRMNDFDPADPTTPIL